MRRDVVKQLRKPHGRVALELDDEAPPGTDLELEAPIVGRVTLTNVGQYVRAKGSLRTTVRMACSRCTSPVSHPLTIDIEELCVLEQMDQPAVYADLEDEDADPVPILDEDLVDLGELVRQCVVVAAPSAVLCRDGCQGLCPRCGCDLNQQACDCKQEETDPRWAALRDLLEQQR